MFRSLSRLKNTIASNRQTSKPKQPSLRLEMLEDRAVPAAFEAGNLVILRIGDGTAGLSNAASVTSLVELKTDGLNPTGGANVIALPSFGTANSGGFTQSGSASSGGGLNLSADGQYLTAIGYDQAVGVASVTGTTSAVANRNIVRIDSGGTVAIVARLPAAFSGNNARSVVSTDGSNFWATGDGSPSGVLHVTYDGVTPATTNTQIVSGGLRTVGIVGGNVVYNVNTSITRLTGLPTSASSGTSIGPALTDAYEFDFLDRAPGVGDPNLGGDVDTLYLASGAIASAIQKYYYDGTTWVAAGVASNSGGMFGMAATVNGSNADLYVTTQATGTSSKLLRFIDTAAYNLPIAGTYTELATAGDKYWFRGIAFAPQSAGDAETTTTLASPSPSTVNFGGTVTFSGTVVNDSASVTPSGTVEIRDGGPAGVLLASTTTITGPGATGTFSIPGVVASVGAYSNLRAYFIPNTGFESSQSTSDRSLTVTPVTYTDGNIAVLQTDQNDDNTSFSIIEVDAVTANQTIVNGFAVYGGPSDTPQPLRVSGSATSTGYLANDNFGGFVAFTGAASAIDTGNINTIVPRGVGTLTNAGAYTYEAAYFGVNTTQTRGATSIDGTKWTIGDQAGIYINNDTAFPQSATSAAGNYRAMKSFGGTVYVATRNTYQSAVNVFIEPTATVAALNGVGPSLTIQDFYLIQSGANGLEYDVLYIVANDNSPTAGTIEKYSLVSGAWVANGSYTTTFGGFGLAAADDGDGAVLYVSSGTGASSGNSIIKLADIGGYNEAIDISTPANVTLYTAPASKNLKGVAFTPRSTPTADPAVANVTTTTATLVGNIPTGAVANRGFVYALASANPTPTIGGTGVTNVPVAGTANGVFTADLSSLTPGATYVMRFYNNNGGTYSDVMEFTMSVGTTTTLVNITPTSGLPLFDPVTLTANVTAATGSTAPIVGYVEFRNGGPAGTLLAVADGTDSFVSGLTRTFTVTSTLPAGTFNDVRAYYKPVLGFEASSSSAFGLPLSFNALSGPISYTTPASVYEQDFDTLPTAATPGISFSLTGAGPFELSSTSPIDGALANGWYAHKMGGTVANLLVRVDNGATSGGAFEIYGTLNDTDRAIGSLASSSQIVRVGAVLVNNTGGALNEFTISFAGEQWRRGGNVVTRFSTLSFEYQLGASAIDATGTFVAVPQLSFSTPVANRVATATVYDGNDPANREEITFTVTGINWLAGQPLAIRWNGADDSGQDDGLAIDDFEFSAIATDPAAPTITSPLTASFVNNLAVSYTATAAAVPAPTFSATGLPGWLSIDMNTGVISGTAPVVTSPTDFAFDVTATNDQGFDTETITFTILPSVIAYGAAGVVYEQDFDGMPSSGQFILVGSGPNELQAAPILANDIFGWSFAVDPNEALRYRIDNGSSSTGGTYSYGSTGDADRALGSLGSGSNLSHYGATFLNDSSVTLDTFTISFTGEQWRRGDGAANKLEFSYKINDGDDIRTGTFTPVAGLDFTAPVTSPDNTALDGNLAENQTAVTFSVSGLGWAPGQTLVVRWIDAHDAGENDALAIDDFSFVAFNAPSVASISPVIGPTTGGTLVTIIGSNFVNITSVTFDGFDATSFSIISATEISAITAAHVGVGAVEVVVTNAAGSGSLAGTTDFTFAPSVSSVEVNGGPNVTLGTTGMTASLAGQHSVVKQILVTFNEAVTVAAEAFAVTARTTNVTQLGGAAPSANDATTTFTMISASQYLVTFVADHLDATPSTNAAGVLNSGVYDLTIVASKIASNGITMAANRTQTFFAMFGNIEANNRYNGSTFTTPIPAGYSSGNGLTRAFVDPGSLFRFSDTFGANATAPAGPPPYDVVFDANLDGSIDPGDLFAFSDSFGIDWTF